MEVIIHKKIQKQVDKLGDQNLKDRLHKAFELIGNNPFVLDTIKLEGQGHETIYRTRIGKYRILFVIREEIVYIFEVDLRGKVYK